MTERLAGPITVGGSGGSGTRIVAEILIRSGAFMGRDLNDSNDDLVFTFLFKHPSRFARFTNREAPPYGDFRDLFELHRRLFLGERPLPPGSGKVLARSAWEHARGRYDPLWACRRLLRHRYRRTPRPQVWGFKEPHLMYFLHGLNRAYPGGRYIHVLRSGLDMAFSPNQQDFGTWGPHYGIDPSKNGPRERFELWYRSNLEVLTLGKGWLGDRFLAIRLEDLCRGPASSIAAVLRHAGLDGNEIAEDLLGLPRTPVSGGRYLKHDTRWIDSTVERKLGEVGYSVSELRSAQRAPQQSRTH